jgi:hypothetical protein
VPSEQRLYDLLRIDMAIFHGQFWSIDNRRLDVRLPWPSVAHLTMPI